MITVAKLQVVPVKGLAALPRQEIRLDADGVADDRRLILLHEDGSVMTIRRTPQLIRVVPDLDLEAGTVTLTFPDGTTATSALRDASEPLQTTLFRKVRRGRLLPGAVAEALSAYTGERVRVLLADGTGVGVDEGPVSMLARDSALAVGTPAEDGDGWSRYRMLIELDGLAALGEDAWVGHDVRVGAVTVHVTNSLGRCVVITRDPATGEKDWEGLRALADARGPDRLDLGVIATVKEPGTVRLGDQVAPVSA